MRETLSHLLAAAQSAAIKLSVNSAIIVTAANTTLAINSGEGCGLNGFIYEDNLTQCAGESAESGTSRYCWAYNIAVISLIFTDPGVLK